MAAAINRIKNKKNGFSLVEVLIALLLLGTVGLGFMGILANSSAHTFTADIRATAESIARSQLENIKSESNYQTDASLYPKIEMPGDEWDVIITGETKGFGLQKISVTVTHAGDEVLTLEGYNSL